MLVGRYADIRVLSYDVRALRGRVEPAAAAIRASRPDLVCVQGAPSTVRWRSRCARLARLSGLLVITGGRTAAGNLLLGSLPVRVRAARDVLGPSGPAAVRQGGSALWGLPRHDGAALAVVELRGATLGIAGTMPGLGGGARVLLDRLGIDHADHVVLAGQDVSVSPGIEIVRRDAPEDTSGLPRAVGADAPVVVDLRVPVE